MLAVAEVVLPVLLSLLLVVDELLCEFCMAANRSCMNCCMAWPTWLGSLGPELPLDEPSAQDEPDALEEVEEEDEVVLELDASVLKPISFKACMMSFIMPPPPPP